MKITVKFGKSHHNNELRYNVRFEAESEPDDLVSHSIFINDGVADPKQRVMLYPRLTFPASSAMTQRYEFKTKDACEEWANGVEHEILKQFADLLSDYEEGLAPPDNRTIVLRMEVEQDEPTTPTRETV